VDVARKNGIYAYRALLTERSSSVTFVFFAISRRTFHS
jgi:hypothetical protein